MGHRAAGKRIRKTLKEQCAERKRKRLAALDTNSISTEAACRARAYRYAQACRAGKVSHRYMLAMRPHFGHFLLLRNQGINPAYNRQALGIGDTARLLGISEERLRRASARGLLHPKAAMLFTQPLAASESKIKRRGRWWYHWPSIQQEWLRVSRNNTLKRIP